MGPAAVLLAAGAGSRFRGNVHKLLAPLHGRRLIDHALDAALDANIGPVIVVTGALDATTLGLDGRPAGTITIVHNEQWSHGQSGSLLLAAQTASEQGLDAIVVALGDQPAISPAAWRAVAHSTSPLAIADYGGERGHPVRIAAEMFAELPNHGDTGARDLLRHHVHLVEPVPCVGSSADVDTVEELEKWPRQSPTNSP